MKSFCVHPPSKCRMSAQSTFLVSGINSLYKHVPKIGDRHWLFFKRTSTWAKRGIICFIGKFSNLNFNLNILDVMLMHHNQCINLCQERCQLKAPFSNICFQKFTHSSLLVLEASEKLMKAYWQYLSGEVLKNGR